MLAAVAAVVVGGVFVVAAVAKFARPGQWRAQAAELLLGGGPPRRVFDVVPIGEALIGALLIVQWQRTVVALVAAAVLVVFTALLATRLCQGRRPPCACFGTISAKPIGWGSVLRNVVLIGLSLTAAFT